MSYTTLRVTDAGVVLYDAHADRLAQGDAKAREVFAQWAAEAGPGVYSVRFTDGALVAEQRPGSRLFEGIAVRFAVSPFTAQRGAFIKPAPPSPYDGVRIAKVATLLTDAHQREVFESCTSCVLSFDGQALVVVPADSPRVASVAEAQVVATHSYRRAPILADSDWPLLLVNAVAGTIRPTTPGRPPFPPELRASLDAALIATAKR